jgi:hypothetical protein
MVDVRFIIALPVLIPVSEISRSELFKAEVPDLALNYFSPGTGHQSKGPNIRSLPAASTANFKSLKPTLLTLTGTFHFDQGLNHLLFPHKR